MNAILIYKIKQAILTSKNDFLDLDAASEVVSLSAGKTAGVVLLAEAEYTFCALESTISKQEGRKC